MAAFARLVAALLTALTLGVHHSPPANAVLRGARQIDVSSTSGASRRVTDPAKVAKIVSWLEALPSARRGLYMCPMIRASSPKVRFVFRAAGGSILARARVLDAFRGLSGPCNPIELKVRGQRRELLRGGRFLLRVQRLLGVRFS
jgi:hypothetical protein